MRDLTLEELNLVSGGDDSSEDIVVVGHRPSPSPPDYSPSPPPYQPPYYGPPPGYGGPSSPPPPAAAHRHTTPSGHTYTYSASLSSEQIANLDKMVDYGFAHNKSASDIRIATAEAFKESSLKDGKVAGGHVGLGQYDQSTWTAMGESGSINNRDDQIAAIYHDIDSYKPLYDKAVANNAYGLRDSGLNFAEYFDVKHHEGKSGTDWQRVDPDSGKKYWQEFDDAYTNLKLGL